MSKTEIGHVSDTALWVATYRAEESKRDDALFHDSLAQVLVGEKGWRIARSMKGYSRYTSWSVVIRTTIIDSYIRRLISEGVDTVVNLGAGLDTRPYRMDLPSSLRWVEVDFPHLIELKVDRLRAEKPSCQLERFKLDFSNRGARIQLFSEISSKSGKILVLTEGVIPYLTNEQVGQLADDIRSQSGFRFWIVDYFSAQVLKIMKKPRLKQMKNAPFQFDPGDWFGFFSKHGWQSREIRYLSEESEKLGRRVPMPCFFGFCSL